MPELPEVETVRRGLSPAMEGARILRLEARRPDLRFPFPDRFAERMEGRTIRALSRRAKYLLADLDDDHVLIMHLGMSGSFRIEGEVQGTFHHPRNRGSAHDHVMLQLYNNVRVIYNDPRRFGFMLLEPRASLDGHALFRHLGPEPTGNSLSADYLLPVFHGKKTPIKAALLDQSLIAGLGNIYVCEALFRSGINPARAAGALTQEEVGRLVPVIREVIEEAIEAGGSSISDHAQVSGELGYFQHRFKVYDREGEPCPVCGAPIKRMVQAGRSTFFCPHCQSN